MNRVKPAKRLFLILLPIIMITSMLTIPAAAEEMPLATSIDPSHAYIVGEQSYATLEEALSAVPSDGTITLQKDANPSVINKISIQKTLPLI